MSRFTEELTDHERGTLTLALSLMFADALSGCFTGEPMGPEQLERELPVMRALFDDLGAKFGTTLDPELMARANARISQDAAAARERTTGKEAT